MDNLLVFEIESGIGYGCAVFCKNVNGYILQSIKTVTVDKFRTMAIDSEKTYHIYGCNHPHLEKVCIVFREGEKRILETHVIPLQNTGICIVPGPQEASYQDNVY